jgi:hypothetical protein
MGLNSWGCCMYQCCPTCNLVCLSFLTCIVQGNMYAYLFCEHGLCWAYKTVCAVRLDSASKRAVAFGVCSWGRRRVQDADARDLHRRHRVEARGGWALLGRCESCWACGAGLGEGGSGRDYCAEALGQKQRAGRKRGKNRNDNDTFPKTRNSTQTFCK